MLLSDDHPPQPPSSLTSLPESNSGSQAIIPPARFLTFVYPNSVKSFWLLICPYHPFCNKLLFLHLFQEQTIVDHLPKKCYFQF